MTTIQLRYLIAGDFPLRRTHDLCAPISRARNGGSECRQDRIFRVDHLLLAKHGG